MKTTPQIYDTRDDEFSESPGDLVRRCPEITKNPSGRFSDCAGPLIKIDTDDRRFYPEFTHSCARCGKLYHRNDLYPPPDREGE